MKAKSLEEVEDLLISTEFQSWYSRYREKWKAMEAAPVVGDDDTLVSGLLLAGDYEDMSSRAHHEFAEIDSDFESLAAFEIQRQLATAVLVELHNAENGLEQQRQAASEARANLEAGRKQGEGTDPGRLESDLRLAEGRVAELSGRVEDLARRLREETARKEEIWVEVEHAWNAAFRANMARAEHAYKAKRVRYRAEHGELRSASAPAAHGDGDTTDWVQAQQQRREAESAFAKLVSEAEERFDCVLIEEFLYWPKEHVPDFSICVPLIAENHHLNVQVTPLTVYQMRRSQGLDFIEPVARQQRDDEDGTRLTAFFRRDRPFRGDSPPA